MRWLNIKVLRSHRFLLLRRFLLFSVILCFLVVLNPGMADTLTDPNDPSWEHPWDDLDHQPPDGSTPNQPGETDNDPVLLFGGSGFWIVIQYTSTPHKAPSVREGSDGPAKRNRGHVLMLLR